MNSIKKVGIQSHTRDRGLLADPEDDWICKGDEVLAYLHYPKEYKSQESVEREAFKWCVCERVVGGPLYSA